MFEQILACAFAIAGLAGVVFTIAVPFDRPRNPYAAPFGDQPRVPTGHLDRGDCA